MRTPLHSRWTASVTRAPFRHVPLVLFGLLAAACSDSATTPQPTSLDPGDRFEEVYPAPVTDLSARALNHRAVELSWTEVDDGKGAPAQYQIRMVEGAEGWEQGTVVRDGACGYPVRGAAVGAKATCVVTGLEANRAYRFLVGSERAELTGTIRGTPSAVARATTRNEPLVAVPAHAEVVSGMEHAGTVGQAVQTPVEVLVRDSAGMPMPGVYVVWASGQGGGTTAGPMSVSDGTGRARTVWTLGPQAGPQSLGVRIEGHDEMVVLADAVPGPVDQLRFSVDTVTLSVGEERRLAVQGWDEFGNAIEDLPLQWQTSDRRVANVDGGGLVRTDGRGWVRIRAWTDDQWRKKKTKDSTTVVVEGDPQAVADLAVAAVGETWLTLAWTEVDDGTGRPARYEIRRGADGASWDQAEEVSSGSCESPMSGTAIGAARSCTIDGLFDGTTHTLFVRSFRKRGRDPVYAAPAAATATTLEAPMVPAGVTPESGMNQAGEVGAPLPSPVVVRVLDENGTPVPGATVSFVPSDGGSVSAGSVLSDEQGRAQVSWTLGTRVGTQSLTTSIDGAGGTSGAGPMVMNAVAPVTIPATANAGPVASLVVSPTTLTLDPEGTASLSVQAYDAFGNPASAADVVWTSSDPSVASVSSDGHVAAVAAGQTTVTAADGPASAPVAVTVQAPDSPPPTAEPGTIDDLRVVEASQTSLLIEFTEVDDGTGNPALAQVRYALSPMGWGWDDATVVTSGACATPIAGTAVGSTRRCEIGGLLAGTSYDLQMVAWRIEDGAPVYSDLSNVATGATIASEPPATPTVARVVSSPATLTLDQAGQTYPLVAVAYDASDNVVSTPIGWSTSNSSVATVSSGGVVTARGSGTALLIASALCCEMADTTVVTVNAAPAPPPSDPSGAWYVQNWPTIHGPEYEHTTPNPAAGDVSLLTGLTGTPGNFTNAMRVTYFANQGREPLAGITLQMPKADTDRPREAWIEFYARWSPNFTTAGPYCTGAQDHKFFFIFQNDRNTHPFTFRSHMGVFGDNIGHYIDGSGLNHPGATALFDGAWHKIQYHAKIDPSNPEWDVWIDGQKYSWVDASNLNPTSDDNGNYLKYLVLSRNMNCGVAQDMSIDYGPVTVHISNPGW